MKLDKVLHQDFFGRGVTEQRCGKVEHKFLLSTLIVSHLNDASWDQ